MWFLAFLAILFTLVPWVNAAPHGYQTPSLLGEPTGHHLTVNSAAAVVWNVLSAHTGSQHLNVILSNSNMAALIASIGQRPDSTRWSTSGLLHPNGPHRWTRRRRHPVHDFIVLSMHLLTSGLVTHCLCWG
ncbi:hypothetical protein BD779DRAFT_321410 [Infundibulicybe gibba]|nr:hypothetical protein BD779DRAFT_321410 [Infundibulicybe gibba]